VQVGQDFQSTSGGRGGSSALVPGAAALVQVGQDIKPAPCGRGGSGALVPGALVGPRELEAAEVSITGGRCTGSRIARTTVSEETA
jgi:hypothetical protein